LEGPPRQPGKLVAVRWRVNRGAPKPVNLETAPG
jgi:hypothetical protein